MVGGDALSGSCAGTAVEPPLADETPCVRLRPLEVGGERRESAGTPRGSHFFEPEPELSRVALYEFVVKTTSNGGSLGSRVDEDRSKARQGVVNCRIQ